MSGNPLFDSLARASSMGLHFVTGMLVGGAMGYGLDLWLGTKPWGLIIFFLCGIAAGFRNVWIDAQRLIRSSEALDAKVPHTENTANAPADSTPKTEAVTPNRATTTSDSNSTRPTLPTTTSAADRAKPNSAKAHP